MEDSLRKGVMIGTFVLLALLAFNLYNTIGLVGGVEGKLNDYKESITLPKVEVLTLTAECADCLDLDVIVSYVKASNLDVVSEEKLDGSSQEAKDIIARYSIKKLPTVLLKGDTDKITLEGFRKAADVLVFNRIQPPYVDAETGETLGIVSAVIIEDGTCDICGDFGIALQGLQQSGVFFSEIKRVDYGSFEGLEIVKEYALEKLPVLLLSEDIDAYPVVENLEQAGVAFKDIYYIIESQAPYVEVETQEVRGIVKMTKITDESCTECYDVNIHKQILARLGIGIGEEETVDISSGLGQELLEKYSIERVPTVVLSGDLNVYTSFATLWQQIGTVEEDNSYVFRELDALGDLVYNELSENAESDANSLQ